MMSLFLSLYMLCGLTSVLVGSFPQVTRTAAAVVCMFVPLYVSEHRLWFHCLQGSYWLYMVIFA